MISDEAVEALARVLANEALFQADVDGFGWNAETDSSDRFMPSSRSKARRYLEAAGPYLMAEALEEAAKDLSFGLGPINQRRPDEWLNARAWKLRHGTRLTNSYRSQA